LILLSLVLHHHAQLFADEVYKETQPFIRSVMDGYNVCILAYGQTGSGKTHTMVWSKSYYITYLDFVEYI
jgi:hypothetical protein